MKIRDSIAFVTGANRGIGLEFARELVAARRPQGLRRGKRPGIPSPSMGSSAYSWM